MEKWSFGYAILKQYIRYAYWLSHQHIIVTGEENIPKDRPIIFAPNHQNALLDPLSVLLTNKTQPVWLARADIFRNKFIRPILRFLKILPVYRIRDGKDNLNKNHIIFEDTIRILKANVPIALFPEATHSGKRQMLAHKKAIPRIAFMAENKFNFMMGLKIVPVGIYYSDYQKFNRSIIVNYGIPIDLDRYKNIYSENEFEATNKLKLEIHQSISDLILDIKSQKHYLEIEKLRDLSSSYIAKNIFNDSDNFLNRFWSDVKMINCLNKLETSNNHNFEELINKTTTFLDLAKENDIKPHSIQENSATYTLRLIFKTIFSIIGIPLLITGFILNGIPFFGLRAITNKLVKDPIFKSSFNFTGGIILFPLFYIVISILFYFKNESLLLSIMLFFMSPIIGKYSYQTMKFMNKSIEEIKFILLSKSKRDLLISEKKKIEIEVLDIVNRCI